jgi:hypothetical protein
MYQGAAPTELSFVGETCFHKGLKHRDSVGDTKLDGLAIADAALRDDGVAEGDLDKGPIYRRTAAALNNSVPVSFHSHENGIRRHKLQGADGA